MAQIGNKQNSYLNGEWGKHVRKRHGEKRHTAKIRRRVSKAESNGQGWHEGRAHNKGR